MEELRLFDRVVDPRSLDEVVWAVSTRSDPAEDIEVMRRTWGSHLDPMLIPDTPPHNSRALVEACVPYGRRDTFARVVRNDPAYLAETDRKWRAALTGDA